MAVSGYLLAILPKFTSSLSVLGSSMIISQVLMSKKNRGNVQQRLLCAMNCVDVAVSTVWFLTNAFVPPWMPQLPWTFGNQASCSFQGFIVQTSISSVIYNACLSLYYLLIVKYNYKDRQMKKIEKWMHLVPLTFGIVTAIAALALDIYNPANWDCWIAPGPGGERKHLANALQWAFFFGPLWVSMLFSSFCVLQIYRHVRNNEKKSSKWRTPKAKKMKQTKAVATQGKLYVGAFIVTWLFPTIARLIQLLGGTPSSWLILLSGTFIPCQGFFNAIVYFRLRFKKCGADYPDKSWVWLVRRIIQLTLCPWCERDRRNVDDGNDVEPSPNEETANSENAICSNSKTDEVPIEITPRRLSTWRNLEKSGVSSNAGGWRQLKEASNNMTVTDPSNASMLTPAEVNSPLLDSDSHKKDTRRLILVSMNQSACDDDDGDQAMLVEDQAGTCDYSPEVVAKGGGVFVDEESQVLVEDNEDYSVSNAIESVIP